MKRRRWLSILSAFLGLALFAQGVAAAMPCAMGDENHDPCCPPQVCAMGCAAAVAPQPLLPRLSLPRPALPEPVAMSAAPHAAYTRLTFRPPIA